MCALMKGIEVSMKSCINVCQKNNLFIIKINSDARYEDIILQIRRKVSKKIPLLSAAGEVALFRA